jgi:esterase/lipase superfamily enzyme
MMPAQVAHLDQDIPSMPNILAIHASDAKPVLETFDARLDAGPITFLNVQDVPNADELRSIIFQISRDIDICLIFSSDLLLRVLGPLSRPQETPRGRYLLSNSRTITFQLNLTRPSRNVRAVWRELFRATRVWPGVPLLRMRPSQLNRDVRRFGSILQPLPDVNITVEHSLSDNFEALESRPDPRFEDRDTFRDPRVVELLFATNRVLWDSPAVTDFTGDRAHELSFGACQVRVPEDHKIGQLELPKRAQWIRLRFADETPDERRHFIIKRATILDRHQFLDIVESDPSRTALVFVHGFNTSFHDSVLRLSQIIWDMQFRSVPILFSWPSAGGVLNYLYDFNSALGARQSFGKLIQMLRAEAKIETLHIIAHSMGNLVVLDALNTLANAGALPKLSEIVMAAPDVDIDLYKTLAANIRPWARGMTLYASANDRALVVSRGAAGKPRAGDVCNGCPILLPNIESIDVSAIGNEMFGLNHNVFADNRSLIDDIGRLVLSGVRPPDQRSPQIRCVPEGIVPPNYWRYVA